MPAENLINVSSLRLRLEPGIPDALFDVSTSEGEKTLSIPESKLRGLFTMVCTAIGHFAARRAGRRQTYVLEPERWALGPLASGRLGVTFALNGADLTFAVPNAQIAEAIVALQRLQAETTPPPPSTPRH